MFSSKSCHDKNSCMVRPEDGLGQQCLCSILVLFEIFLEELKSVGEIFTDFNNFYERVII